MATNDGDNTQNNGENTLNDKKGERRDIATWLQFKEAVADPESYKLPPLLKCIICLDDDILTPFTPPDRVATAQQGVVLFCGHMFCEDCYLEAMAELYPLCPVCREDLTTPNYRWDDSCKHPAAHYRFGNKPLFRAPVTLSETHAWGIDPQKRIVNESWDSLSPAEKKRVPLPLHCRKCRTERAKGLAQEFHTHGRAWKKQPLSEVLRQLDRKGPWTGREMECAIPTTKGRKNIMDHDKHDYEAFVLHNMQEQLHLENDTWGGPAPAHPGDFDEIQRLAIETSLRETGKTPAQLRKEAEERLELEIQEQGRNYGNWW
ncbi:hypothetical protein QBC40DRAFT_329483 [Triangularia verruculosa]|uniref:RING-type domain-containing protein n=1 Tax=Triangularia verruculosa TaxID=2587418 RepID=A0AAN6XEX7_9PEZI|nr:hypothetical protein QBC40DRAFT_329483 [Triangularia verruculosa]